jgi:uncharacterized protein YegP (UPF0339 family)
MASVAYQLHKSASSTQPYYWRVVSAGNSKVLATSETYVNKSDAIAGANLVRLGSGSDAPFTDYT